MTHEDRVEDREVVCPSCTRFVGTYETCPYCGAAVFKRLSVRFFRWGSLVVAFVGLICLWLAARGIDAPLVKVQDLTATMSMGQVRVEGKIVGRPSLHPEWKSLYVQIDDQTGTAMISAYDPVSREIMDTLTPAQGDVVSVQGMVRVQQGSPPKLQVQAAKHFRMVRRAPPPEAAKATAVAGVTEAIRGKRVIVTGKLVRSGVLDFGAYKGILRDETGDVVLWVEPERWPRFPAAEKAQLTTDAEITVRGKVETFFDKRLSATVIELIIDGMPGCVSPAAGPGR